MITLLSNICQSDGEGLVKFLDDSYLRGLLFHDSWASNVRNVRRSYPPRHFPRPCFFFNPPPSLSSNQPRLTLNLQRESRFLSSSIGLALVHESLFLLLNNANSMPVPSLLFIFLAFTRISFEARASWFYDLGVMVLSDNPVSYLDLPSFGIFQLSRRRFSLLLSFIPLLLFSFFRETCLP